MSDVDDIIRRSRGLAEGAGDLEAAVSARFAGFENLIAQAGEAARSMRALADSIDTAAASVRAASRPLLDEIADALGLEASGGGQAEDEEPEPKHVSIARRIGGLKAIIDDDLLPVDPADYRFAEKAVDFMASADQAKAARLLFDCVRFMDVLERDYNLPGYERLMREISVVRGEAAAFLKDAHGIEFIPDPASPLRDAASLPDAKRIRWPSAEPEGKPLALLKRGAVSPAGREQAEVLVSSGSTRPVVQMIERLAMALLAPGAALRRERGAAAREIRQKYLPQLPQADADREATVLRYAVNAVQPLNRGGALNDLLRPPLSALAEHGFRPIPVRLGGVFDDSYSTGKYERKSVQSFEPKGTIVDVLQVGFVNRDGVPVQKSVVGVSNGGTG